MICDALTWTRTSDGKDYVQCELSDGIDPCRLEGIMLAIPANLCRNHQKYFAGKPEGWRSVEITNLRTGKKLTHWDF